MNSLDFHRTEDLVITASDDDSIRLYSTETGERAEVLYTKKYGATHLRFTHHPSCVLSASHPSKARKSSMGEEVPQDPILISTGALIDYRNYTHLRGHFC